MRQNQTDPVHFFLHKGGSKNEADTKLKDEQRRWEPVKAMSAAFGAGVAVASGLIALAAWILAHFIHA